MLGLQNSCWMTEAQGIDSPPGPVDKLLQLVLTLLKHQQQRRNQSILRVSPEGKLILFLPWLTTLSSAKASTCPGLSFQVLIANEWCSSAPCWQGSLWKIKLLRVLSASILVNWDLGCTSVRCWGHSAVAIQFVPPLSLGGLWPSSWGCWQYWILFCCGCSG